MSWRSPWREAFIPQLASVAWPSLKRNCDSLTNLGVPPLLSLYRGQTQSICRSDRESRPARKDDRAGGKSRNLVPEWLLFLKTVTLGWENLAAIRASRSNLGNRGRTVGNFSRISWPRPALQDQVGQLVNSTHSASANAPLGNLECG
jgi:hypothetical protein